MNFPLSPIPTVSVVIPTRCRPTAVIRSVDSVLRQTLHDIEVIVVVDGPDPETVQQLKGVDDHRLRIVALDRNQGSSMARDVGIENARSPWIATLDDDDVWMPLKLEIQLREALRSSFNWPIVGCRFIQRNEKGDLLLPKRLPQPDEPVGDYLLCRYRPRWGDGAMQTSTLFAPRSLFLTVPFQHEAQTDDHDDLEWVIRAAAHRRAGIVFVSDPQPLSIWIHYSDKPSISRATQWRESLSWVQYMHRANLITKKAYTSFILSWCSMFAARVGDWRAVGPLLKYGLKYGWPRTIDVFVFFANWAYFLPTSMKKRRVSFGSRTAR